MSEGSAPREGTYARAGAGLALGVFLLDQLTKLAVILGFGYAPYTRPDSFFPGPSVEVFPFFNLSLVWNRGVSFGLFQGEAEWQRWLLILFSLVVAGGLVLWLRRAADRVTALAVGAVIGGAIGNLVDRLTYAAVVDFFDFHAFGYHWYVFNVADSAIVLGVAGLLYVSFIGEGR